MGTTYPGVAEMDETQTVETLPQELAHRENDGVNVWLLWDAHASRVFVLVHDSRLGDSFEVEANSAQALEVFHHPYAYAAARGVGFRTAADDRQPAVA